MAKAKKIKRKRKGATNDTLTQAQIEKRNATNLEYYENNKARLRAEKKKYYADIRAGKRTPKKKKGGKSHTVNQREKWRLSWHRRSANAKKAKQNAIKDEYDRLFGKCPDPGNG
jgi:hypothetical protein